MKTGKDIQTRINILILCILALFSKKTSKGESGFLDSLIRYMTFKTDVTFRIGTIFDFFIFSTDWEDRLSNILKFEKGLYFLDVGAHIGRYTTRAGVKVGKEGKVISIEPKPQNYRLLAENIRLNGLKNCIPLNVAAYKANTEMTLYVGKDSAKNSLKQDFGKGSVTVKARTLDSILEDLGLDKVDLIKIDVEEAEYDVLLGLQNTLRKMSPKLVIEMEKKDENRVINYLRDSGYKERLVDSYPEYKSGLMFYLFEKTKL